ncbi:MAG: hypothetical protein ACWA5W_01745 [Phycisphaerales bacterium]
MPNPKMRDIRVIRYAQDGGYAAREWLNAFASIEFPPTIADGESFRMGVQITKKRAIDVILRLEHLNSFTHRLRGQLNKTTSDSLFRRPKACRKQVPKSQRPLAVLSARHQGKPIRILVCQPKQ